MVVASLYEPNHFRAERKVGKFPVVCGCLLELGWHNRIQQLVGTSIAQNSFSKANKHS